MRKLTIKLPDNVYMFLSEQAALKGIGIQKLAGLVLIHGINDILAKSNQSEVQDVQTTTEGG